MSATCFVDGIPSSRLVRHNGEKLFLEKYQYLNTSKTFFAFSDEIIESLEVFREITES